MTASWYNLNLPDVGQLNPNWTWPVINDTIPSIIRPSPADILSKEWLKVLQSYSLTLFKLVVFYRPANFCDEIAHVDTRTGSNPGCRAAINFVYGGMGSAMHWYDSSSTARISDNNYGGKFINSGPINTLTEIDSANIAGQPVLVRIDIPHAISAGKTERWCVSIRCSEFEVDWEQVVDNAQSLGLIN
jgi:hypothetical protein